jgi:transmembrane sensor
MEGKREMVDHELLGKYFSGESSPLETRAVEEWRQASLENAKEFEALGKIWQQSPSALQTPVFDVDAAWEKVQAKINSPQPIRLHPVPMLVRIAAVVVLAVAAAWLVWPKSGAEPHGNETQWVAYQPADSIQDISLPDGSKAKLREGSRLSYHRDNQKGGLRQLKLEGEAYFDVAPDKEHPFVVEAGQTLVRAVGTAFNVRTNAAGTEVVVEEGKVSFGPKEDPAQTLLLPGHAASLKAGTALVEVDSTDKGNGLFWLNDKLVYHDRPLQEVVEDITRRFGKKISLGNKAQSRCRLSATFEHPTIESILNMIAETYAMEVAADENGFTLLGDGCQ